MKAVVRPIPFPTNGRLLAVSDVHGNLPWLKVCQLTNQVEYSEMSKCGANYKINLLSLALGVSFYIPTKK